MVQQNYNTFKSVSIAGFLDISILVKSIFLYSIMDTKFYIKHDCQLFSSNTRREEAKSYESFIKKKYVFYIGRSIEILELRYIK